jgi:negative regulator of sigma E activity
VAAIAHREATKTRFDTPMRRDQREEAAVSRVVTPLRRVWRFARRLQARAEQARVEQARVEQARVEQARVEQARVEQARVEWPALLYSVAVAACVVTISTMLFSFMRAVHHLSGTGVNDRRTTGMTE